MNRVDRIQLAEQSGLFAKQLTANSSGSKVPGRAFSNTTMSHV